jgi:hypothetical protein
MNDLAPQIEAYLLAERRWVSSADLCERFGIRERALRQVGDREGLCSSFAISGDKGFRHVLHASPAEWERFEGRIRSHGIAELVRIKRLRTRRNAETRERAPFVVEKETGQAILLLS